MLGIDPSFLCPPPGSPEDTPWVPGAQGVKEPNLGVGTQIKGGSPRSGKRLCGLPVKEGETDCFEHNLGKHDDIPPTTHVRPKVPRHDNYSENQPGVPNGNKQVPFWGLWLHPIKGPEIKPRMVAKLTISSSFSLPPRVAHPGIAKGARSPGG